MSRRSRGDMPLSSSMPRRRRASGSRASSRAAARARRARRRRASASGEEIDERRAAARERRDRVEQRFALDQTASPHAAKSLSVSFQIGGRRVTRRRPRRTCPCRIRHGVFGMTRTTRAPRPSPGRAAAAEARGDRDEGFFGDASRRDLVEHLGHDLRLHLPARSSRAATTARLSRVGLDLAELLQPTELRRAAASLATMSSGNHFPVRRGPSRSRPPCLPAPMKPIRFHVPPPGGPTGASRTARVRAARVSPFLHGHCEVVAHSHGEVGSSTPEPPATSSRTSAADKEPAARGFRVGGERTVDPS